MSDGLKDAMNLMGYKRMSEGKFDERFLYDARTQMEDIHSYNNSVQNIEISILKLKNCLFNIIAAMEKFNEGEK